MASLISKVTGNFTASTSWGVVDTTSELDSSAASTAVGTSNLDSATFTPGAITVDGVALKIINRQFSGGTFTVTLRNSTDAVNVTSVTINVVDLTCAANGNIDGWIFFKFSADQTLIAGKAYLIRVVCSVANQITLYRNATAANWSRKLRTTTEAAPGVNDHLIISNQFLSAGSSTAVTITMDNTTTTSFGPTVSGGPPEGMTISGGASLTFGTAPATAYYLKLKGHLKVSGGAVLNIGTSGTRIPSGSSASLEFASVANGDSLLQITNAGTINAYGEVKTRRTTLTTTLSATGTSITVGSTSGWQNGDEIAFSASGSGAFPGTYEKKTASSINSSTTATIAAATNTHTVDSQHNCYVANLTSNVRIFGTSTSFGTGIQHYTDAVANYDQVEFFNLGNASLGHFYNNSTGAVVVNNCVIHKFVNAQVAVSMTGVSRNYIFTGNVVYDHSATLFDGPDRGGAGTNRTCDNNYFIGMSGNNSVVILVIGGIGSDANQTFAGNVITGKTAGFNAGLEIQVNSFQAPYTFVEASWENNIIVQNQPNGFYLNSTSGGYGRSCAGVFKNFVIVNHAGVGVLLGGNPITCSNLHFKILKAIGCQNGGFQVAANAVGPVLITDGTFGGTTSRSQAFGLDMASNVGNKVTLLNCDFGVASSPITTHATADIRFGGVGGLYGAYNELLGIHVNLASTTKLSQVQSRAGGVDASYARFQSFGKVDGDHRSYFRYGTITSDSVIFRTASPSERITPLSASIKIPSGERQVVVSNGLTKNISVYVRKSVVGDAGGANYNGNQPRLIVRRYDATGVASDTVLDTMTAAIGTWEELTGTTIAATDAGVFKFFVDCDGTAGWINVDDITVS